MRKLAAILGVGLGAVALSSGQSFNIDLDELFGTELTGNGAPSASFGAAANQSGAWNRIDAAGPSSPVTLSSLSGMLTGCQLVATGGGGLSGGFNNPALSGDFRLLMADGKVVGTPVQYHFSGMQAGHYSIFTYSANANGSIVNLTVQVPGSVTPPQTITGPMPANQFVVGVNYCVHELDLAGTSFEIDVSGNGPPNPEVHGFQIVFTPVPEPTSILASTLGLVLVARRGAR